MVALATPLAAPTVMWELNMFSVPVPPARSDRPPRFRSAMAAPLPSAFSNELLVMAIIDPVRFAMPVPAPLLPPTPIERFAPRPPVTLCCPVRPSEAFCTFSVPVPPLRPTDIEVDETLPPLVTLRLPVPPPRPTPMKPLLATA